jgi:hypothetical protein
VTGAQLLDRDDAQVLEALERQLNPLYGALGRRDWADFDEALAEARANAHAIGRHTIGTVGFGVAHLLNGDGKTKHLVPFHNIVTDAGDEYIAKKTIVGVLPANFASPPALASGMKLGTGTTAINKPAGTGLALATYITGSNNPFDSGFPQTAAVGTNVGWNSRYQTSWLAGDVTNAAIAEVAIANDAGTDATSAVAATYARALISAVNKTASDSLVIDWRWKHLGS